MIFLTFLTALTLSAIAGYYSIVGLALIFPGAFWPVVIMGAALEVSKLVTASWLYRNWKKAPILLKTYLTTAVIVLMLITSMGIFGFLSKAHIEHSTELAPMADKMVVYENKIAYQKELIATNKELIKQMDNAVNEVMSRTDDARGAERALKIRRSQGKDRAKLVAEIDTAQKEISRLMEEQAPEVAKLRSFEADLGPIKYVSELVYGNSESDVVDKAVRMVIIIIMLVFDPLAVLLLIAGNMTLREYYEKRTSVQNQQNQSNTPEKVLVKPKSSSPRKRNTKPDPIKKGTVEVDPGNITNMDEANTVLNFINEGMYTVERK